MLYVIYRGNNPELSYRGGQEPIVHLQADLHEVVAWATNARRPWAFSLSNAGAVYTRFRSNLAELDQIDWRAVAATDFRRPEVKEGKQAEFLLHGPFPWGLITRIGVYSGHIRSQVERALHSAHHLPKIEVRRDWYY